MIIANLMGGLGNQLFQIAAGYALANKNNDTFHINYNLKHNKGQGNHPVKYRHNLYVDIPDTLIEPKNIYNEPFHHYSPIPYTKDMMISGYFQSEKYFKDCVKNPIKNLFKFPESIIQPCNKVLNIIPTHIVAIHIRLGDYKFYPDIHGTTMAYYHRAIKNMQEYYSNQVNFIICSDEKEYVINEFPEITPIISNSVDELQDLYIISQCNAVIMSNSSFSWWGTYLGKYKQRVICPKVWFKQKGPQDFEDIYLRDWIRMD